VHRPGLHPRSVRWTDRALGRDPRDPAARPAWLPRGTDELLLTAALRADEVGRTAWERFVATGRTPDPEQERLLPLVADRRHDAPDHPWLARGRALRAFTRARAHWITHRAAPVVAALTGAHGPPLLLKGLPLALWHYPDPGLRPLHDLDLLVRPVDFPAALAALEARGYTLPVPLDPAFVVDARGMDARAPDGGLDVDVHWQVHRAIALPGAPAAWGRTFFSTPLPDDPVWGRSVSGAVADVPVRVPSPADLLLHVVVHAAAASGDRALRWAADAAFLVAGGGIDWAVVTADARRRGTTTELTQGLRFLRDAFAVAVPDTVLDRLDATPVGIRETIAHTARTGPPPDDRHRTRRHAAAWVSRTAVEPWPVVVASAPRYLRSLTLRTRPT